MSNFWYCFFAVSVCAFNSLPKGKYSNLLIVAAFSKKFLSGKISLSDKNSNLPTFSDEKAEILVVCLSKFYWALFCNILLLINFLADSHFIIGSSKILMDFLGDKVVLFTKKENVSLV